jgi:t-SNARE complex subunit (syntaxin)
MSEAARKMYGSRNNYLNSGADLEGMLEVKRKTRIQNVCLCFALCFVCVSVCVSVCVCVCVCVSMGVRACSR